ncbi:MAG: phosphomannomutase/phosphoglucomutase [Candidatus Diapherotrites archaeon]
MKIAKEIFRQYDIRGIAGKELNAEAVEAIGKAFGSFLHEKGVKEAVVGRDNRKSSRELSEAVVRGLVAAGCNVVDLGEVITPMLYYARHHFKTGGGIMVTGSHNPPEYNGLKLAQGHGCIYGKDIQKIRELVEEDAAKIDEKSIEERGQEYPETGGALQGTRGLVEKEKFVKAAEKGKYEKRGIAEEYAKMLEKKIVLGKEKKLKIVLDCGNGTASLFAEKIFMQWGCEVEPLFCDSDSGFPNHFPDPTKEENLKQLIEKVKETGADAGIAFDGDADRIGVVDEKGGVVWGDMLMVLFARELLKKRKGEKVLVEVKCSQALIDEVEKLGGKAIMCATGHSLIEARMREENALLTGEMSGHIFFADEYFGFDDAFYAAGRLLRILSNSRESLSEMLESAAKYYSTPEMRIDCSDSEKFNVVEKVKRYFKAQKYDTIDVDGVRVLFKNRGWALVRASNTEPKLIVRAEAKTSAELKSICVIVRESLNKVGVEANL